jgi:hypothetical protein
VSNSVMIAAVSLPTSPMSPENPTTCQESQSVIAEYLGKYEKISTFSNGESEPADADVKIVEDEIKAFVYNLLLSYSPRTGATGLRKL